MIEREKLAPYLDLANHKENATYDEIDSLCQKVLDFGFTSVFLNPYFVKYARQVLGDAGKIGTTIAFPLGQDTIEDKIYSSLNAASDGANELDVSTNVGLLKGGQDVKYFEEMKRLVTEVKAKYPAIVIKFIIEAGFLEPDEVKKASVLVLKSGADFVKTTSGMGPRGASLEDVKLIREAVGQKIKVKVAGGITTYEEAAAFIEAGADRIGTSKAVEIVTGSRGQSLGFSSE